MTPATDAEPPRPGHSGGFTADSLAVGILLMVGLSVIQRGVGFVRNIWFCRLLDDTTVGRWAMAFGFITLITPVMMLGLGGAIPRYVERYRQAGQLRDFIRRIMLGILVGSSLVLGLMVLLPHPWGWLVFREPADRLLIWSLAGSVAAMLVFNFVGELVNSLRQLRVNSWMQFFQGVGFTLFSLLWLVAGGQLVGLLHCFTLATLLAILPGLWVLVRGWPGLPHCGANFNSRAMWRRLLPYAVSLWLVNLLSNAFELADRYMILHFTTGGAEAAGAAVGQYHSGRLLPTLLCSLAAMLAGMLMPYLAADWEATRRAAVVERLRRGLLGISLVFTLIGAVILWVTPLIFTVILQGRYPQGLAVMPAALVVAIWGSLASVAMLYVWLHEQGKWIALLSGIAILVNVTLNAHWLPRFGLDGAIAATLVSSGLLLAGLLELNRRLGFGLDPGLAIAMALPLTLLAGPWAASAMTCLMPLLVGPIRAEALVACQRLGWRWQAALGQA